MSRIIDRRALVVVSAVVLALVLAMSTTAYALGKASVGSREIKNGSVKARDLADGAVTSAKTRDGSLGGRDVADGSLAGVDLTDGSVGGADLADGSVGGADLANGSVGPAKLADGSVGTGKLADGAVTGAKVTDGSLTGADVATMSIGGDDLYPGAVGSGQLATLGVVASTSDHLGDADGTTNGGDYGRVSVTATCPMGSIPISGGAEWVEPNSGTVDTKNLYLHSMKRVGNGWTARGIVDTGAQGFVKLRVLAYCLAPGGPQT